MARAALEWSLDALATAAGVSRRTVLRFESGEAIQPEKMEAMRATLVAKGIVFTNGGKRAGVFYTRND